MAPLSARHPDGTETAEITAKVSESNAPYTVGGHTATHKRVAQTSGSQPATTYLDAQGRPVRSEAIAFDGRTIVTLTQYNEIGQKVRECLPYFHEGASLGSIYWTDINYDDAGRVCRTDNPDGGSTKVFHNGLESYLYNANDRDISEGQKQTRVLDENDRLVRTIDNDGGTVFFYYDVQGNLVQTEAPGGHLITATFDIFGQKTGMFDSDTGTETTTYNAFGDPLTTTDEVGNSVTLWYDPAGRVIQRRSSRGTTLESTVTTQYLANTKATDGLVDEVTIQWHENGSSNRVKNHYDRLGRPIGATETRTLREGGEQSGALVTETFNTSLTYDSIGRVLTTTNAGGLTLRNEYNEFGFKKVVRNHHISDIYWTAGTYDASGRMLTETLGNGVVNSNTYNQKNGTLILSSSKKTGNEYLQRYWFLWDRIGNLLRRSDLKRKLNETFEYDHLNRLTSSTVGNITNTATYDAGGNILTRSDRGTYTYDSVRKHQLKSVDDGDQVRRFHYDANGSLLSETRQPDGESIRLHKTIRWGAHGKMSTIFQFTPNEVVDTDGSTTYASARSSIAFDYDAAIKRVRKVLKRLNGFDPLSLVVTDYLGSYERTRHRAIGAGSLVTNRVEHRHHIGALILTTTEEAGANGPREEKVWQLKDHLGSTSALLDDQGEVLVVNSKEQIFSYDSWGQRRDAATWLAYSDAGGEKQRTSKQTNRGYTGHEMMDEVGLVHMNGRIYDSEIGRFLSADPHVQAPENSQNYNRYAYVLNNPLSYTDPSGYFFKKLFKAIGKFFKSVGKLFKKIGKWIKENWRTVLAIAFAFVAAYAFVALPGLGSSGTLFGAVAGGNAAGGALGGALGFSGAVTSAAAAGALGGAFNAAINGGDLGDILKGAIVGGLQAGISAGVLHGFQVNEQIVSHIAGHGVVGGVSNVAMGGKFGDGFIGGAAGAAAGWVPGLRTVLNPQTSSLNVAGRTALAGVIGGTVSALSGGKFANGAYTAAFQHLFNAEAGRGKIPSEQEILEMFDPVVEEAYSPILIDAGGNLSEVQNAVQQLPTDVLSKLKTKKVKIVATRDSVVEYASSLQGKRPRGYPPGETWDTVAGAYIPRTNSVVVATSGKHRHGSFSLTLHEVGHAYDRITGYPSRSAAFRNLWTADKGRLGPYFTQPGNAGLSEAYAEGFARHHGGDRKYTRDLPNLSRYW